MHHSYQHTFEGIKTVWICFVTGPFRTVFKKNPWGRWWVAPGLGIGELALLVGKSAFGDTLCETKKTVQTERASKYFNLLAQNTLLKAFWDDFNRRFPNIMEHKHQINIAYVHHFRSKLSIFLHIEYIHFYLYLRTSTFFCTRLWVQWYNALNFVCKFF